MTREIKALQLSCIIHAILVFAILGAVRTVSVPLRIDLMDFTVLGASGMEMSSPTFPGADKADQDTSSVKPAGGSTPPIIKQQRQKLAVQPPSLETLSDKRPQAEPALPEPFVPEDKAVSGAESATQPVLPKPVVSSSDLSGATPSGPPTPVARAQAASSGTVTGQHPQTSQEQYLTNHFTGIRRRILRNLSYPAVARKKGWQGQVRLCFRINHEGGVDDITVLASSGYTLLDRRAMDVVRQVAPFPKPLENAEITMPITFSLRQ